MKIEAFAVIIVAGIAVSGCATIVEGTTQPVSVTTTPEEGAQCTLMNSQGTWYLVSPGSTTVHKTKTDLKVTCNKQGYEQGQAVAVSHFGAATAGNVIAGGLVGMGVDAASGANYHYDSPIVVALGSHTGAQSAPTNFPSESAMNAPPRVDLTQPHTQIYPVSAQANGESGAVVVGAYVNENGKVVKYNIQQSSGFSDLDDAALQSVLNWHFVPAKQNGNAVSDWTTVKVIYQLPQVPGTPATTH